MPTPSDIIPPVEVIHVAADAENARYGCPPEDRREQHAPSEEQVVTSDSPAGVDITESEGYDSTAATRSSSKAEQSENESTAAIEPSSPSAIGLLSPPPDSDYKATQLAQSMSHTAISPAKAEAEENDIPSPLYLHYYPELERNRHTTSNSTTSFLRPGSRFRGTQQSDRQVYEVQVELKDVDLAESTLCGYLRIQGLTDDHPTLTTFFEGEIIGPKYLFRTSHPSWGSSEKVDLQHWARFPPWRPEAKAAKSNPNYTFRNPAEQEYMFMRWKEYFLVPDHRVKTISGASFEGFYYICFNQASGKVSGIYFHAKSEKYQQLELNHVEDRGCGGAVEFR